ncbi:hypothetical protein ACLQ3D_32795 [Micromonospora vinacea]|uniref:hypothetical protein n=1 Tax=Micromonospora TaxID=1873 RepID=UPI003863C4D1|nr:hypothetical protein OH804_34270 [Micromonospora sp. NBC_00860]
MDRNAFPRAAALSVTALLAVVGCAGPNAASAPPSTGAASNPPVPSSAAPAVRLVEEHQADLHLWVSNQSFTDDPVVLSISIDGAEIVDQGFAVEGQHNFVLFPVRVPPGRHVVRVVSGTGVDVQETFTMPGGGRQYAAIGYVNSDGRDRSVDWFIQSTPIAFA